MAVDRKEKNIYTEIQLADTGKKINKESASANDVETDGNKGSADGVGVRNPGK